MLLERNYLISLAVNSIWFHALLFYYKSKNKKRAERVPQTSSVYRKDPYAPAFNGFMVAHQSKGFSNRCPQSWVTGLLQTQ